MAWSDEQVAKLIQFLEGQWVRVEAWYLWGRRVATGRR